MSIKNGKDYLYLVWKCNMTRRQYIVGELCKNGRYEFRYGFEINEAIKAGFTLLVSFEDITKVYYCDELFPVFLSRLPDKRRKDIDKILNKYGLNHYDAYELLKLSGARLPIDSMQFIDPILDFDIPFERRFYMAGVRHYVGCNGKSCDSAISITRGDEVFLKKEPKNEYDENAIQVVNSGNLLLGYIPRYYSKALSRIMEEGKNIVCHVVHVDRAEHCNECVLLTVKIS